MSKHKIIMYQKHLAYLDNDLVEAFDKHCSVVNFAAWVRKKAKEDFNLTITAGYDLTLLDNLVVRNYYTDKADWLREKMRTAIRSAKDNKQTT